MNRITWTDDLMLDALHMRDHRKMTARQIAEQMGTTKSAILGLFKRIADDEAASPVNPGEGSMRPNPVAVATVKGLLDGLGAEDIAVRNGLRADDVRFQIRRLRASDALASLIGQARKKAGKRVQK